MANNNNNSNRNPSTPRGGGTPGRGGTPSSGPPSAVVRGSIGRGRRGGGVFGLGGGTGSPFTPPAAPSQTSPGKRPSLGNLFNRPDDLPPPPISPTRLAAAKRTSTWSRLPGGFPNWSSSIRIDGGLSPLQLTFRKAKMNSYTSEKEFSEAEKEINRIKELVDNLGTDSDEALEHGMCEVMSLLIFGSNAIERVGLSDKTETMKLCEEVFSKNRSYLDEVPPRSADYLKLLDQLAEKAAGQNAPKNRIRPRKECINHAAAFLELTNKFVKEGLPFTEKLIQDVHAILVHGLDIEGRTWESYAGKYRVNQNTDVVYSGSANDKHYFTEPRKVPEEMEKWVSGLEKKLRDAEQAFTMDPFAIAADAAWGFVNIHPFMDGNGHMSRLISAAITIKYTGICTPIGEGSSRQEYAQITVKQSKDNEGNGLMADLLLRKSVEPLKSLRARLEKVGSGRMV